MLKLDKIGSRVTEKKILFCTSNITYYLFNKLGLYALLQIEKGNVIVEQDGAPLYYANVVHQFLTRWVVSRHAYLTHYLDLLTVVIQKLNKHEINGYELQFNTTSDRSPY